MSQQPRIVITGMGIASPLGCGIEPVWQRLLAGKSGMRHLPDEMVNDLPAKVGGVVPSFEEDADAGLNPDAIVTPKDQRKMDRFILLALVATEEALQQARWQPTTGEQQARTATIIASGVGGFPAIADAVRIADTRGIRKLSPFTISPHF